MTNEKQEIHQSAAPRAVEVEREVHFQINGEIYPLKVRSDRTLLDLLRWDVGLTGTKENCRMGSCGACTVLVEGQAMKSCLLLAVRMDGKRIETIEGLSRPRGGLHPLQQAFIKEAGFQCGYCTPGFIMMAKELLEENRSPAEEEIKRSLVGNICRCTGYGQIIRAVQWAARRMREEGDNA